MPQYKCSACDHIFLHQGKKRPVCPECNSLFAEEVDEIEKDLINSIKILDEKYITPFPKNWINKLEPDKINDIAREIEEQIKKESNFSAEDQENIREDILKEWKTHLQHEIEQVNEYDRATKSLEPKVKDIVSRLESISGKMPTDWKDFLYLKLQTTPSYFRNLERTRRKIMEEWEESLIQFEKEFDKNWESTIGEIAGIDESYKKSLSITEQGIRRIGAQLKSDLVVEQTTGFDKEQKRHEDWLKNHIEQVSFREDSEQERQTFWDERFSSPEQLWIVMKEEWRLSQERKKSDIIRKRSEQQNFFQELMSWFETKKRFYSSKIRAWDLALQELKDNHSIVGRRRDAQ